MSPKPIHCLWSFEQRKACNGVVLDCGAPVTLAPSVLMNTHYEAEDGRTRSDHSPAMKLDTKKNIPIFGQEGEMKWAGSLCPNPMRDRKTK